ncbi:MAG: hypothetical protein LBN18_03935, partial [Dysgonamonadaceae bacterium]|nr:hypothetical protein [Dysgonamonadaceae bacterium]
MQGIFRRNNLFEDFEGLPQQERLIKLNQIAIQQMRVLQEKELLNTLSRGNTLIAEMFEKLKTPSYRYEYA